MLHQMSITVIKQCRWTSGITYCIMGWIWKASQVKTPLSCALWKFLYFLRSTFMQNVHILYSLISKDEHYKIAFPAFSILNKIDFIVAELSGKIHTSAHQEGWTKNSLCLTWLTYSVFFLYKNHLKSEMSWTTPFLRQIQQIDTWYRAYYFTWHSYLQYAEAINHYTVFTQKKR